MSGGFSCLIYVRSALTAIHSRTVLYLIRKMREAAEEESTRLEYDTYRASPICTILSVQISMSLW